MQTKSDTEAVSWRCFVKKVFLKLSQNSPENTCARVSFSIKLQIEACNFIKKETLAQMLFCEFSEISNNTFPYRTPPVATSSDTHMSQPKFLVVFQKRFCFSQKFSRYCILGFGFKSTYS